MNEKKTPLISVYMQVYNTPREYLETAIRSVLAQTYSNFEFILIDNGSTDGSDVILQRFADEDSRIKLIQLKKNKRRSLWDICLRNLKGEYLTQLDSDDWWDSAYLESLVQFAQEEQLDIACTGTCIHMIKTEEKIYRKVEAKIVCDLQKLTANMVECYVFFRTIWGKLIRVKIIDQEKVNASIKKPFLAYGGDTCLCFQLLRTAERIGIDTSVLHHYRVRGDSVSYEYDPQRFTSDVFLYNDAMNFLREQGPVSAINKRFLSAVFANAAADTLRVIELSKISPEEKMNSYREIAAHPVTDECFQYADEPEQGCKMMLIYYAFKAAGDFSACADDLIFILKKVAPRCALAVNDDLLVAILEVRGLMEAISHDDPDKLMELLLTEIQCRKGKNTFLFRPIQALAKSSAMLSAIDDVTFITQYTDVYFMVWKGMYIEALDRMTGILLDSQVTTENEDFLALYLNLAAYTEQPAAYVFGSVKRAQLLLGKNRMEECKELVAELIEMGAGDDVEVKKMRNLFGL